MLLVLKNATVFDGVQEELLPNSTIILDEEKIKDIFPNCQMAFDDAEVIDLNGAVIAPGFIDCHLHLMLDEVPNKDRALNMQSAGGVFFDNADAYVAYRSVEFAKKNLEAGFTTVIDGGGVNYIDVALKDAIKLGYVQGPDYYISGKQIIAWTASHFRGLGAQAAGPDEMRRAVRDRIYYGVDQIKLEMSAPLRSIGRSLEKSSFTVPEIQAATDEAHSLGLLVSAHARGSRPVKDSLLGGVDLICHGTGMDDEAIEMMLKGGNYLLPTLASPTPYPCEEVLSSKSSRVVDLLKRTGEIQWESTKRAYQAGVKIALSTDSGAVGIKHGENAKEMLRMREIGMSNVECLRAATSEAAKAMHLEDKIGRIQVGMKADLVVLSENPVKHLETVCDVKMVIKNGKVVKNAL